MQGRPIKISADASQSRSGAVILQKDDDFWQTVAYGSRLVTDGEK